MERVGLGLGLASGQGLGSGLGLGSRLVVPSHCALSAHPQGFSEGDLPLNATAYAFTMLLNLVGIFFFAYIIAVLGKADEAHSETQLLFQAKL